MLLIGDWCFDAASRRLLRDAEERRLTPKAAAVLSALAQSPGRTWSRGALMETVWPGVTVCEEVLTHAITELRKALGDRARSGRIIETVHKSGYRLVCNVQPLSKGVTLGSSGGDVFDPAAYAAYLEALELEEQGGRANTLSAIALYSSVIASAPVFSAAHVRLAKAMTFLDCAHPVDAGGALEHCAVAHRLQPDFASAYAVEGHVLTVAGEWEQGVGRLMTAIRLAPDSAEAHYLLARACLAATRLESAAVLLERAARLDFEDYHSLVLSGKVREMLGDEGLSRANLQLALPRIEARLMRRPRDSRALCGKVRCLLSLGRQEEAYAAMELAAAHPDPIQYNLACMLARVGETARALDLLEEFVGLGWRHSEWLERDPDLNHVRGDPRYQRLAASIS